MKFRANIYNYDASISMIARSQSTQMPRLFSVNISKMDIGNKMRFCYFVQDEIKGECFKTLFFEELQNQSIRVQRLFSILGGV